MMTESKTEKSSTQYWQKRVSVHLREMRLAKATGLFPKKEGWRNVVEHELVEAEGADIIAEALGLSSQDRQNIYLSCLIHDVEKRRETELINQIGPSGYERSQNEQADLLRSKGYSEDIIKLTQSVGGGSLLALIEDPKSSQLKVKDDIDLPTLIVHYVDDITLNNDIVPLNQRIDYLENNPRYNEGNEAGRVIFTGRTYFQVQREVSRQIEEELAKMLKMEPPEKLPDFIREKILEKIELERLEQICLEAARQAFNIHEELGSLGKQPKSTNRFGEKTLLGDWECEEAVIDVLKNSGLNIKVISEEHGEVKIGEGKSDFLAVLDGIDGTYQYKRGEQDTDRRYGTMFAFFKGSNPKYSDYQAAFIMEHPSKRLFMATKGGGAYVIENGQKRIVKTSGVTSIHPNFKVFAGEPYGYQGPKFKDKLSQFNPTHPNASSRCYSDLIIGAVDAVCEYTRKGNLELAIAYGLIREAEGVMITDEIGDLGEKKFLEYGQRHDDFRQIVSAASHELAIAIYELLK